MVAVKLWFYYGISNLKASALMCKHPILQPQYTDNPRNICEESLQMHFKVVAKNFYAFNTTSSQMSENERLSFEWYALVRLKQYKSNWL